MPLPPLQEHFKLMAYCDDLKPSISCMAEFKIIDEACFYFEKSFGCFTETQLLVNARSWPKADGRAHFNRKTYL